MTDYKQLKQVLTRETVNASEPAWLRQMPTPARDGLLLKLVKQVHLLRGMTRTEVLGILNIAQRVIHPDNTTIFREGDDSDRTLHILISGKVEVVARNAVSGQDTVLATLTPGQTFGEMALVEGGQRSAAVRTLEQSVSLRISALKLEACPDLAAKVYLNIARILSRRLRESNLARMDYDDETG